MKYIVKNCPSLDKYNTQCLDTPTLPITEMVLCQNCTDCVIKQVIRKCRRSLEVSYCPIEQEILQLFDIEEINK